MKNKGLVVLSGGQDSTTTALFARKECKELHGITFNYDQKNKGKSGDWFYNRGRFS